MIIRSKKAGPKMIANKLQQQAMLNERRASKQKNTAQLLPLEGNMSSSWTIGNSIKVKEIDQGKVYEARP
jgi:hypothetical protein